MTTSSPVTAASPTAEPEWGESLALMPHEEANLRAFEGVFPHWNSGNIAGMLEHYEDDIVWHNVAMGEVYDGKDAVRRFLEDLYAALPDLQLEVTLRLPRGRYVAEEYVIRGTHLGPMFGLPATGRRLELRCTSMVELRNGRLKEDHFYFDALTAMRQMGLMPPVEATSKPLARAVLGVAAWLRRRGSRR
jgi:steroid delta-isomerase-like uncharacterized protein